MTLGFPVGTRIARAAAGLPDEAPQQGGGFAAFLANPALQQALIGTGSALLQQADSPGTFGGALGRALPAGMQAFERAQRAQEFSALLEGMDPTQRRLFELLGPDAGAGMLAQSILQRPEPTEQPTSVQEYLFAQSQGFEGSFQDFIQAKKSPAVQVNVEGDRAASAAQGALGTGAVQRLDEGRTAAVTAATTLERVTALQELLDDPAAEQVTGPGSSVRTFFERFDSDPAARQIAAQIDALAGLNVLDGLNAFSGPISDSEREFVARIQAADRSLTVEELRAALQILERAQRGVADSYLGQLESFDGEAFGIAPGQLESAHSADAARVRRALGGLGSRFNLPPRPGG